MIHQAIALIFHHNLLPLSETFVLSQARSLREFSPFYVGVKRTDGLSLPENRTLTIGGDGWRGDMASKLFKATQRAPRIISKLRGLKPVLLHAHFEPGGVAALPIARALGLPIITTFHGFDATVDDHIREPNPLLRHFYQTRRRKLQREGALFLAVSEFIRNKVLALGYPPEKVITHRIGVDLNAFTPSLDAARTDTVLFVGRLVEKKGCAYLVDAMMQVFARNNTTRLVIIGDGPLRSALESRVPEAQRSRVEFTGSLNSESVRAYMARSALLVAPSVTANSGDSEGLPIVVCEAQAMGLPVVGSRHAGIPEVLCDGRTGFLVPERSVGELSRCISLLLDKPELRRSFGEEGRAHIEAHFNLRRQTEKLEQLYWQAAGRDTRMEAMAA